MAVKPHCREAALAEVEWHTPDLPDVVNVKNLTTALGMALGE
jgi:hypothetical protein